MNSIDLIDDLSERLYELFIVNSFAAGIQQPNGIYITKYFPVNTFVVKNMILKRGSMGCYQQGYKNDLVKWICFDFDCKDKINPDVHELYEKVICPFTELLNCYEIKYLTEFSGRRGIHVWILFDSVVKKSVAYAIMDSLYSKFKSDNTIDERYGVDLFPATSSSKGNIVGKQVKLPLSVHKGGRSSYFFNGTYREIVTTGDVFYQEQLDILVSYERNKVQDIIDKLRINSDEQKEEYVEKYHKYSMLFEIECSVDEVERILTKTKVYRDIFHRMNNGVALQQDWYVMLGTLGGIDKDGCMLVSLFKKFPAYNAETTKANLIKWKSKYNPATFNYLYGLYNLEMEDNLDGDSTGLEFLFTELNLNNALVRNNEEYNRLIKKSEKSQLNDVISTWEKEKNYLLFNDEVIPLKVSNDLNDMCGYDFYSLKGNIEEIYAGQIPHYLHDEWYIYNRIESDTKQRALISLGAKDRIITTHVAMQLAYDLKNYKQSFSYNVSFISQTDIFYNWYSSWGNYIDHIRAFLEVPFLADYNVIVIDIKKFYDSIDFLSVNRLIGEKLSDRSKNIFKFLVQYNDLLMRQINHDENSRIGVPQGPAYARIIAEIFLNSIIEKLYERYPSFKKNCFLYRYVDDMIFFYDDEINGEKLYNDILQILALHGLSINKEKSKIYGKICRLTDTEKKEILRKDRFDYQLQVSDINYYLSASKKLDKLSKYLNQPFSIDEAIHFFSKRIDNFYSYRFYTKFKKEIFSSIKGRGSIFARFYKYLFEHNDLFEDAIQDNCFQLIPMNSINFKNFLCQLYLYIQNNLNVNRRLIYELQENYLRKLKLDNIDVEERTTVKVLLSVGENYD